MDEEQEVDLEFLTDLSILPLFLDFDQLNLDTIQRLFRDPSDGWLNRAGIHSLEFVNDWQFPFRTMIWRYKMQHSNPFLLWNSLDDNYRKRLTAQYGLHCFDHCMKFFVWLIEQKKITERPAQRVVELFSNGLPTERKEALVKEYNESLTPAKLA